MVMVNLVKLCVGITAVGQLEQLQATRRREYSEKGRGTNKYSYHEKQAKKIARDYRPWITLLGNPATNSSTTKNY